MRKHRSDGNTNYFGPVEIEETLTVDLCLCFLSLRRVERERREGTGYRCSGTGAALAEAGEGGGEGAGRRVALSSERRDCLKIEMFRVSGE